MLLLALLKEVCGVYCVLLCWVGIDVPTQRLLVRRLGS